MSTAKTDKPARRSGSEPARTEDISSDPRDYLSGPTSDTVNATEGGTTKSGGVAVFGTAGNVHPVDDKSDE